MFPLKKLVNFLDEILEIDSIPKDSSNNGLQVQGRSEVGKAVFGVDACAELFREAAARKADFVFTHHGMSWGDNFKRLTDITSERLKLLFNNGLSLYAAHLPLDIHPVLGHNAKLAKMIKLQNCRPFCSYAGTEIGIRGKLKSACTPLEIGRKFDKAIGSDHIIYGDPEKKVKRIGIISGDAAATGLEAAPHEELDCFVTGEISHSAFHLIEETGTPVVFLGHYCSEKPGVFAVMDEVRSKTGIDCEFIELPTGL